MDFVHGKLAAAARVGAGFCIKGRRMGGRKAAFVLVSVGAWLAEKGKPGGE